MYILKKLFRIFLLVAPGLLILQYCPAQVKLPVKPNVIFILADDLGYGDLQCYGNPWLETPRLNELANCGVKLDHYYSPSPLCAPARGAILTGMFNHRTGDIDVPSNHGLDRIALSYKTMGDYFKGAGYATGIIGKWHSGLYDRQYYPNQRGFDHFFGFLNGIQDYWKWNLDLNGTNVPSDGRYLTDVITEDALDFINKHKSGPFFLFIAHHAPHVPLEAPDSLVQKYLKRGKGALNTHVATIYAMIEEMDHGIGKVIDKIEELNLSSKTIIVFTSDNGGFVKGEDNRYENGLTGNKGDVREEGIRVPAIVSWPGVIPSGQVVTDLVHGCDWLPTLYSLTGSQAWPKKPFDGYNIMELLRGHRSPALSNRTLYFQKNRYYPVAHSDASITSGTWKLYWPGIPETMEKDSEDNRSVRYGTTHPAWEMPIDTIIPLWQDAVQTRKPSLFNIVSDPSERNDVADQHPEVVRKMTEDWDNWFSDIMKDYKISWNEIKKAERKRWPGVDIKKLDPSIHYNKNGM